MCVAFVVLFVFGLFVCFIVVSMCVLLLLVFGVLSVCFSDVLWLLVCCIVLCVIVCSCCFFVSFRFVCVVSVVCYVLCVRVVCVVCVGLFVVDCVLFPCVCFVEWFWCVFSDVVSKYEYKQKTSLLVLDVRFVFLFFVLCLVCVLFCCVVCRVFVCVVVLFVV